jgi:hypothetical protein
MTSTRKTVTQEQLVELDKKHTHAVHQLGQNVTNVVKLLASQQDVSLAGEAVDARFDSLRVAIEKSTDFETLKTRLLAVL